MPRLTSDNLEGTGLLVGLLSVVLGGVLLSLVKSLELIRSGGLVALLGLVHSVSDLGDLVVDVLEGGSESTVDGSLDGLSDGRGGNGLDKLVEQVVVRVSDGKLEGVNVDINVLDREGAVSSVVGLEGDLDGDTLSSDQDVGDTGVLELGPTRLPSELEDDISEIGLDLAETQGDDVVLLVGDLVVGRELEVVVRSNLDDVGGQVGSLQDEVLDNKVDLVVRVFGSGNRDVSNVPDDRRKDDPSDVVQELGLVRQVTLRVEQQVLGQSLPVLAESSVQWVITHGGEEIGGLVTEVLEVSLVLVVEVLTSVVPELLSLSGRVIVENVTRLEQDLVDVLVGTVVPVSETLVLSGVGVHLVDSIPQGLHRSTVGEPFEQGPELQRSGVVSGVVGDLGGRVLAVRLDVLGVSLVVLGLVEEEVDSLLVVLVLLAVNNDLLESVNELLPSLLGESVVDNVLGLVDSSRDPLSVLVGDGVESPVLGLVSVLGNITVAGSLVGLASGLVLLLTGLVLGLVLLGSGSVDGVTGSSDVLHVGLGLLLQVAGSTGSVLSLALSLVLGLVSLVPDLLLLLSGLVNGTLGGSLLTVGTDNLGVSRVVLGVSPELGTVRSLDLELGGLVSTDTLSVGRDPLASRSRLVDLVELLVGRSSLLSSLAGGGSKDITGDETKVVQELSSLGVGSEQGDEGSEVGSGLVGVGLVLSLAGGHELGLGLGTSRRVSLPGGPDEVLEKFTVVLLVDHHSGAIVVDNKR